MDRYQQADLVTKFFYLTLLDEDKATQLSIDCIKLIRKNLRKKSADTIGSILVFATTKVWTKWHGKKEAHRLSSGLDNAIKWPGGLSSGLWKQFIKVAPSEEALSLIWSLILKIPEVDIATGLGVTEGTVRYRVSRGIKVLGQLGSH